VLTRVRLTPPNELILTAPPISTVTHKEANTNTNARPVPRPRGRFYPSEKSSVTFSFSESKSLSRMAEPVSRRWTCVPCPQLSCVRLEYPLLWNGTWNLSSLRYSGADFQDFLTVGVYFHPRLLGPQQFAPLDLSKPLSALLVRLKGEIHDVHLLTSTGLSPRIRLTACGSELKRQMS
jgi:hypothetical protein